ncbi:arsenical pump-driving ATPase [Capsaspora owczarzaki ATCC 30864]|uniref:ATPase ASNA1 homolog n=1 Tax=Capsaspora owczarzaki (strain ATCC 30864) TaxID=595528 RepID=A0A0D2UCG3_CAPO3|nr:arsenical pump-driving ATPase [Capsaspora owczarzaki ATCC 30864]KJE92711.1 arsenical pump-driving ATPase [Capsaspora owczarzaki ATCC 30864]|eukprot:XP_004363354.1 arsenical pump-driving ATPase [Capsaspora owczarzaki ATCC 30864]
MAHSEFEPSIRNLLDQNSLRWIFVGGKGGVGKTTCSSSIAIQLAKVRQSVLLVSTDPAHNLSDAFGQKFSKEPSLANGFSNLYVCELDAKDITMVNKMLGGSETSEQIHELLGSIPGIDEALSFAEMMNHLDNTEYSVVVFDTAPTGHTLRLLSLPVAIDKGLTAAIGAMNRFAPMISSVTSMLGRSELLGINNLVPRLEQLKLLTQRVQDQFKDPARTTFVCVCIAEFLSLYETERLIQELTGFGIDVHNIIVNQLVEQSVADCTLCDARVKLQGKYLDQIADLYEDFHVIKLPLLTAEVRGSKSLTTFSERLVGPAVASKATSTTEV